jgi:hypothetical protein
MTVPSAPAPSGRKWMNLGLAPEGPITLPTTQTGPDQTGDKG